ncbi:peptidyl-prolyl cis-trans isomerase B (cyclophilin B) [Labedella gwakjiensis]|uniref:peptidylprolyl isomerase n=1 Tax=Labedella gwakjiensis TaxID=390269 RepID=A0A2P8GZR6_9MICO|nr:peptidylprolyl isomerase [Labedella gwakjiensis]PSL39464.1 peptidyl-prolyl cis-trans isomerase B (cyclophilin B) [Labedella gwakjiensis]
MAASKNEERAAREARQRLKAYKARQAVHAHRTSRRVRDNWIAAVLVVVVASAVTLGQLAFLKAGPFEAAATPSASASADASAAPAVDLPSPDFAEDRTWTGTMTINDIPLGIELDGAAAPQGVSAFVALTQAGFYDGLSCHRLTTSDGFGVLQCGDPNGDGSGGPGFSYGPIENAPDDDVYPAGTIAMARQSGDGESMGSQFFIVYEDTTIPSDEAGGYTVLGQVTSGLDGLISGVVDAGTADGSTDGSPAVATTITSVTVQ